MNTADLLTRNAQLYGGQPALIFEDERWTYSTLERQANRVAGALRKFSVRKGDRIALYSQNCPQWVEVFFAASKLGAVLVPIDFRLRPREVRRIVMDARPAVVFFGSELRAEIDSIRETCEQALRFIQFQAAAPDWALDYENLANSQNTSPQIRADISGRDVHSIIYTSGTTGRPKAAVLSHANIVIGTHQMSVDNLGYAQDDIFLNPLSFTHRAGWSRLIQSVGVGATMVLMRRFEPDRALKLIERHKVTFVGLVPTMARMIIENDARHKINRFSVRVVMTMGEACPMGLRKKLFDYFPRARLISTFASTETGIITLLQSEDQLKRPNTAGRSLPGMEIRILNDDGKEQPRGEIGEIAVRSGSPGSASVMLGYLNSDVRDAQSFRDGWFLTGDCGYMDRFEYLYVTDRKKDVILSGGLNIYSIEVESCLMQHPDVCQAAVVAKPDPRWGEIPVAFVVPKPGTDVSGQDLITHCKDQLASYKKPRLVHFVKELPQNAFGKVVKSQLRERARNEEIKHSSEFDTEG